MKSSLIAALLLASLQAARADFASEILEATFKFYHADSTSTCFLVKRDEPDKSVYLVTTAHTLERTKGETAILVLRDQKKDASYSRHDLTLKIRSGDKPLWVRHEKQDVAVLKLTEPLPTEVTVLPTSRLADEARLKEAAVHVCSLLFVLTYPQRFEANRAGFPVARQGIFASPPMLPSATHPTFLGDFITFAGDSGGPVFIAGKDDHPLIVGIVLAQNHHDEKVKTEYEETTIHHPLNLGTILHARYVIETLDQAAK
jgi:hypothetical protein